MTPEEQRAELERRAERVLALAFNGIHHVRGWAKRKADAHMVEVALARGCDLATFDGDVLTYLVIAAHDECVRVSLRQGGPQRFVAMFHWRSGRDGKFYARHPTIEQAIATVRGEKPAEHELVGIATALADRLDAIAVHPSFQGQETIAYAHGHRYTGPTWAAPLAALRAALSELPKTSNASENLTDLRHAEHLENGNCWRHAYPCTKGCPSVCDRCHEHDELRAACPLCARCLLCGRTDDDGKSIAPESKEPTS